MVDSLSDDAAVDQRRRRVLSIATTGMGLAGGVGLLVPFAGSFSPSEKAKAAGAPIEVDISKIEPGQQLTYEWRGKPVWIINRTPEMLAALSARREGLLDPDSTAVQQPEYARNTYRSIKQNILVLVGICTHLGCSPKFLPAVEADWDGGFLCACHGSRFDLAGRVFTGAPAPRNLEVPPHKYVSDDVILIGSDKEAA